jgi:DNA-binding Lrp family transcriptional regulator
MSDTGSLDRIDRQLLRLLAKDARRSNKELAAAVGLAPSRCHSRVRRLEHDGRLRGYHASVDPEALGLRIRAMIFVQVARHTKALLDGFLAYVKAQPEVVDTFYVAGSHDVLIHVAVCDVEHLRELVNERVSAHEAIGRLETSLIFEHAHEPVPPQIPRLGLD